MINNKQKAELKRIAHSTQLVKFNIGKDGIDANVLKMLRNAFDKYELVKVAFLKSSLDNFNFEEMIIDLSSSLNATINQKIGKIIILYKKKKKIKNHIVL